jgi:hypothetical protein
VSRRAADRGVSVGEPHPRVARKAPERAFECVSATTISVCRETGFRRWRLAAETALPVFAAQTPALTTDIVSAIRGWIIRFRNSACCQRRTGDRHLGKACAQRYSVCAARSLVDQLIATIEACRVTGLPAALGVAVALAKDDFLVIEDLERLMQTIAKITGQLRYEDVDFGAIKAVSVSLVRAECVKLAVALKDRSRRRTISMGKQ